MYRLFPEVDRMESSSARSSLLLHTRLSTIFNFQVKNIPPLPQQSRRSFILRSTLRAVKFKILFDVGQLYVWYNPAYSPAVIGTQSYAVQFINAAAFIGVSYWSLNAPYYAAAAGSVAIGLHHPRMWPDLFGAWRDAYTVRRFWG